MAACLAACEVASAQTPPSPPVSPALALQAHAQSLYQQGRERFLVGDYAAARGAFEASLNVVDSPNARLYLGRVMVRLGELAGAWSMLDRAARDADARCATEPRYAATRDAARAEADALAPRVAWLTVEVADAPEGVRVRLNDVAIQRAGVGVPLPIDPGEVRVVVEAPGYETARETRALAGAARETLRVTLRPVAPAPPLLVDAGAAADLDAGAVIAPPPPRSTALRDTGITLVVAGAAGLATGLAFGLWARSQHATLEEQQATNSVDPGLVEEGTLHRNIANGLFAGSSALAATGLVLWLVGARQRPARGGAPLRVQLSPGGGVGLAGTF